MIAFVLGTRSPWCRGPRRWAKDVYRLLLAARVERDRRRAASAQRFLTTGAAGGVRDHWPALPRPRAGVRPPARPGHLLGAGMNITVIGCSGSFAGPESPATSYLLQGDHQGRTWRIPLDLGNGALRPLSGTSTRRPRCRAGHPPAPPPLRRHLRALRHLQVPPRRPAADRSGAPTGSRGSTARAYGQRKEPDVRRVRRPRVRRPATVGPFTIGPAGSTTPSTPTASGWRPMAPSSRYTGDTGPTHALTPCPPGPTCCSSRGPSSTAATTGGPPPDRPSGPGDRGRGRGRRLAPTHIPPWNDPQETRPRDARPTPAPSTSAVPGATYTL